MHHAYAIANFTFFKQKRSEDPLLIFLDIFKNQKLEKIRMKIRPTI